MITIRRIKNGYVLALQSPTGGFMAPAGGEEWFAADAEAVGKRLAMILPCLDADVRPVRTLFGAHVGDIAETLGVSEKQVKRGIAEQIGIDPFSTEEETA